MDVNGTAQYLRLGEADWAPLIAAGEGLELDPRQVCVRLRARPFRFGAAAGAPVLGPSDRRGAARDAFGTWFWIEAGRRGLRYWPAGQGDAGSFWDAAELTRPSCPAAPEAHFRPCAAAPLAAPPVLSGLAVTRDHYLLVGTLDPAGLLVFDLHGGGAPVWQPWLSDFRPWDLAADGNGGVWVLDTDPVDPAAGARLWHLDCTFQPIALGGVAPLPVPLPDPFQPVDGPPRAVPPAGSEPLPLDLSDRAEAPVAVEHLVPRAALILDNPAGETASRLVLVSDAGDVAMSLAAAIDGADLRAHDLAFVPDSPGAAPAGGGEDLHGTLYLVADSGNQAFAFRLRARVDSDGPPDLALTLERGRYFPMRRFAGRGLVSAGGAAYYDIGERWVALAEQPQPLFETSGGLGVLRLDSGLVGCRWHRLALDGCLPNGTGVRIETRAANHPDELALTAWSAEPTPYLRPGGSELPWHRPFGDRQGDGLGTWETLFQRAEGRYLELRLALAGTGRSTPRLWALRVHAPRFSYRDAYLPAVYREDAESAHFLDRWLANPEGLLTTLEGQIAAAEGLLDPRTAPAEYLDWLAGWLGAVLDPAWADARRRLFIAHAALLFRWRGTPSGLLAAIRIAIDPCPAPAIFADLGRTPALTALAGYQVRIIESYEERLLPGVVLGDATAALLPAPAAPGERWQPAQGAARLHGLFRDDLAVRYPDGAGGLDVAALATAWETTVTSAEAVHFPPLLPSHPVRAADWRAFVGRWLALPYADVGSADLPAWRAFLAARYPSVATMNGAHGRPAAGPPASFAAVTLPAAIPEGRVELNDWMGFVSLALPIRRHAHRFTVLVPATPGEDAAAREARLAEVRAVVERERPAHTSFEVKPYWALFRVGTARLGLDTVLGEGSRYAAIVLAAGYLGEGYLAESHPWNVRGRWVAGRDPIIITRSAEA